MASQCGGVMNETTRQTLTYQLHDLENQLRVNEQHLDQAHRDVVAFQAKVNHDRHRIAELKATLTEMDKNK